MTIPSDATKDNCGSSTADPKQALLVDLAGVVDTLNLLLAHLRANGVTVGTSNVFTADQTIRSTDDGASTAPTLVLDRESDTPEVNDQLGGVSFNGRDSGGNLVNYAAITSLIIDATDGSEDGRIDLWTSAGGTLGARAFVQQGLFMQGASGGDKGTGSINAAALYDGGVAVSLGLLKAWAKIQGSTGGVFAGQNITNATVTRNGTGDYTVGFVTSFATAHYAVSITAEAGAGDNVGVAQIVNGGQLAGSVRIKFLNASNVAFDPPSFHIMATGAQ